MAKAIKIAYPNAQLIERQEDEEWIIDSNNIYISLRNNNNFPSIKNGASIAIDEILADGQNLVDGHNKED